MKKNTMMTYMHIFEDGETIYEQMMYKHSEKTTKKYRNEYKTEMLGKRTMVVYI